ncbi:MAG: hypothetical protein JWO38_6539 [Gemmataceae bacterium]|nr:hypothetical protein [Gemmataceae bacterium]
MTRLLSLFILAVSLATVARGQDAKPDPVKPAPSKIVAVTLYQANALVTREVTLPETGGLTEVVVSPLPPFTLESSLYAEGGDGLRVLSVRFRTRAIAEDTREEVRKLEAQLKTLNGKVQGFQADLKAAEENLKLLDKLEGFTAKTLETVTDKGQLDPEKVITLAKFVQDDRAKRSKEALAIKQQLEATQEQIEFNKRLLGEKAGGSVRTERDAVIVVDKKAGAGTVRLNYLVSHAAWRPLYKFRAGAKDKDAVTLEYLAAVEQQTGEDWTNVNLTLSTAQPLLNAAPPDLRVLEVSVGGAGFVTAPGGAKDPSGGPAAAGGAGGIPNPTAYAKDLEKQAKDQRRLAADNYTQKKSEAADKQQNDAAALEQFRDLLLEKDELAKADPAGRGPVGDGPSVTYRTKGPMTVPSRNDEQVLEITRFDLTPRFYYKAVPVLTPNVYRIADLTNTSEHVLLPGEATMYLGSDFVGQTKLPLVAVGKPFTVGFGVDPQLQVSRVLLDKTRTTQGGNQVLTFKYRIAVTSYKKDPVSVQVWDRMPHAEAAQTIAVTLNTPKQELSTDPLYVRDEKPKGLLRWDVTVQPNQNGEKALMIEYEFKLELDKNINIGGFLAK